MKRLKIKSTVMPKERPGYLEWCRMYRVGHMVPKEDTKR
jgi:hypothetical protein